MPKPTFIVDRSATLEFYPPVCEKDGAVPASAAVTLYYPDACELAAEAAGTIDSVDTTVSTTAAKGARSFVVTSATGIAAGRRYLVAEAGRVWPAEVGSIASTTVYPTARLPFGLTGSTATVKGYRCSLALTATNTDAVDTNYRARWIIVADSTTYVYDQLFDIVGADHSDAYPTTYNDVVLAHPWVRQHLSDYNLDLEPTLTAVWQQRLVPWLRGRGMRIERVRDIEALVPLHVAMTNVHFAEDLAMIDSDKMEALAAAQARQESIAQSITSEVDWYDSNDDMAADDGEQHMARTFAPVTR